MCTPSTFEMNELRAEIQCRVYNFTFPFTFHSSKCWRYGLCEISLSTWSQNYTKYKLNEYYGYINPREFVSFFVCLFNSVFFCFAFENFTFFVTDWKISSYNINFHKSINFKCAELQYKLILQKKKTKNEFTNINKLDGTRMLLQKGLFRKVKQ